MARAKLLLQEIETYAQNIGDTIRDPLLILDRDLCVKSANRSFYKTFQEMPEDTEGRVIQELGDGQWNIPPLLALLRDILPTKGHFDDYEVTHDFPKIGRRTMLLNARKLYRPGNRTVLLVLAMEDITERNFAKIALTESEEHFRTLYETMAQGVLYQNAKGTLISANPAAQRLLGLSIDEMAGRVSADPRWKAVHEDGTAFPGDDHPPMRALRTGQPVLGVVMGVFNPRLNEMRWLSVDGVPQFRPGEDRPYQVYSKFEDITEARQAAAAKDRAEEKARDYATKLESVIEQSPAGIYIGTESGITTCNALGLAMLGFDTMDDLRQNIAILDERIQTRWADTGERISPDQLPFTRALQGERVSRELEYLNVRTGHTMIVQCDAAPVLEDGRVIAAVALNTDISERKAAEAKLLAINQREKRIASTLQRALLFMPQENAFPGLQVKMLHEEASEEDLVGGDFWDIFAYDNGHVALVIGDVMGHGLTAAVFTAEVRFILRAFLREHEQPALVLNQLNAYVCQSHRLFLEGLNDEGDDAPICLTLAVINAASGEGQVACAGMEPPLLARADGTVDVLKVQGMLLGVAAEQRYESVPFHLDHGDTILMTTDGITEARHGNAFLGSDGLRRLVDGTNPLDTLEVTAQALLAGARAFGDGSFCDDVCLVLARRQ